ncbi:YegS/Rv2252/BmrU family lipid kinase [Sinanaerobacter chloroacetimidivorans]|jgi:diacylglycerol kinase (ATP)|uniref:YegS/Rv2252/BmrU family lipid kinase n=1 Tax=Sinanaerobacter chloroacetimidivorans TaxID=2818044 RepID=A0A8J7W078_9FIRM|nr:YegS/Rv2252/BmrU family lipid kinase [Sinanaerobacter chloroacetimidivorans]MBR0596850.1 YegS/Rv2252/BmrU family lipid kinase [Sinanaerobacter chloroacetimidivorans]
MKKNKVLLFYNPNAGNGLFKNNLDLIIEKFQKKRLFVVPVRADRKGILNEVLKDLNPKEYKKIIAAGGDGTINIVVNAMLNHKIDLPLAIFPSGTANDFAYYFDLPHDIESMMRIALDENYTYTDIGKVNDKYFINVAAMGFLVDVSQKTDPNVKNTLGVISYYLKGVQEIPNIKPIPVKITSDEYSSEDRIYFMLVMNGRSAGGFKRIAPKAEVNDGLLDVMLFKEMPIIELPPLLFNVMTGQHHENKNVVFFQTKKLRVESDQFVSTDVDGEKGAEFPLDIQILPKKLKINTLYNNMEGSRW